MRFYEEEQSREGEGARGGGLGRGVVGNVCGKHLRLVDDGGMDLFFMGAVLRLVWC